MHAILVSLLFVTMALAEPDRYTEEFDNIDIDEILNNDRLLQKYIDCLLDEGDDKCTREGKALKKILRDALQTDCAKCNEKQKEKAEKAIKFLVNKKRPQYDQLAAKYDPDGTYMKKHQAEAKEKGINL